jgi:hypothetical protein
MQQLMDIGSLIKELQRGNTLVIIAPHFIKKAMRWPRNIDVDIIIEVVLNNLNG